REERTSSASAIVLGGTNGTLPTNNLVANNVIYNILSNGSGGEQVAAIGIAGGNGDQVVYNSIYLTGDVDPNASAAAAGTNGYGITVTAASNLTIKNNIVKMDLSSSSAPTIKFAAINVPASFAWGTGGSNYNNFYVNPADIATKKIGCIGGTDGAFYSTLNNWQAAASQDA